MAQPQDAAELGGHAQAYPHSRAYRSMYVEPGCACTSLRQCLALESTDGIAAPATGVFAPTREPYRHHRCLVKAPERSRPHQEFLGNMIL